VKSRGISLKADEILNDPAKVLAGLTCAGMTTAGETGG